MAALNLVCDQGSTFTTSLEWQDGAGSPIDLTGYSARMQVRTEWADDEGPATDPVLDLTDADAITLGGALGTVVVTVDDAATEAIPYGRYVYDLELVDVDGVVTRLVQGRFTVRPEVTR